MNIYHIQNKAKLICYDLHPQTWNSIKWHHIDQS
jgi:hypothetical protein